MTTEIEKVQIAAVLAVAVVGLMLHSVAAEEAEEAEESPAAAATALQPVMSPAIQSPYIAAGSVYCIDQRSLMQWASRRTVPNVPLPAGCLHAGADFEVRSLQSREMGSFEFALVGMHGLAVWVMKDELR